MLELEGAELLILKAKEDTLDLDSCERVVCLEEVHGILLETPTQTEHVGRDRMLARSKDLRI